MKSDYPVRYDVDRPGELDRLTTGLRIFVAIPIAIVLGLMSSVVVLPTLLLILFRQKYPRWWFDFNVEYTRFSARVDAYLGLLRDEYPSTDEKQAVHVDIDYPKVEKDLNRWLPLVKWLLAIPHYIVLLFLGLGAVFAVIIAWFAILFTGRYPEGLFNYVVGVQRWGLRVVGYAFLMVTDRYPPFSLEP